MSSLIKTNLAITVKCKCGSIVCASLIYGGDIIDEDMTQTMAEIHHKGGEIKIINTDEESITMNNCKCVEKDQKQLKCFS